MKKKIGKIIILVVIVCAILFGKSYIDNKTFDYTEIVSDSLSSYFISGNSSELKPIIDLLDKYKSDSKITYNIQSYSFEVVGSWYTYLDDKYYCDKNNLNSCKAQLEEFKLLAIRLNDLYTYKNNNGYSIILPSAYNNLKSEGEKKVAGLEKIVASPSAKNPSTSEEIRLSRCKSAIDCESCREGLCKCYYITENKTRDSVMCVKENQQ